MNIKELREMRKKTKPLTEPVKDIEVVVSIDDAAEVLPQDILDDPLIADALKVFAEEIKDDPTGGAEPGRKHVTRIKKEEA